MAVVAVAVILPVFVRSLLVDGWAQFITVGFTCVLSVVASSIMIDFAKQERDFFHKQRISNSKNTIRFMKQRNIYFDFLRGVAIIMVVAIHTFDCSDSIIVRQILNTAVPMFIAISGFFLSSKNVVDKENHLIFLKRQIPKVYIPTLFWSLPWFTIAVCSGGNIVKNIIYFLICGFSIYYFIAFIIQCYVALSFIVRTINRGWGGVIVSSIISLCWIAVITYFTTILGISLPLIVYAGMLPCWIMFFTLGVALGTYSKRAYSLWLPIMITIIGFGLSVVSSQYLWHTYHAGVGIKPSSFVYAFGVILLMFNKKTEYFIVNRGGILFNIMVKVGNISFAIYLTHIYMLKVLDRVTLDNWFLRTFITFTLTYIFVVMLKRIVPHSFQKYIGV